MLETLIKKQILVNIGLNKKDDHKKGQIKTNTPFETEGVKKGSLVSSTIHLLEIKSTENEDQIIQTYYFLSIVNNPAQQEMQSFVLSSLDPFHLLLFLQLVSCVIDIAT